MNESKELREQKPFQHLKGTLEAIITMIDQLRWYGFSGNTMDCY